MGAWLAPRLATTDFDSPTENASTKLLLPLQFSQPVSHADSVDSFAFGCSRMVSRSCSRPSSLGFGSAPGPRADRSGFKRSVVDSTVSGREGTQSAKANKGQKPTARAQRL